jgi:hypothetical protein
VGLTKNRAKKRKSVKRAIINLSLTLENAEFLRAYHGTNSGLVNKLIETYRIDVGLLKMLE